MGGLPLVVMSGGLFFIAVCELLVVVASLISGHWLSNCGAWAWLLPVVWDLPGPGIEPMSPALAGGLPIPEPPGKSLKCLF